MPIVTQFPGITTLGNILSIGDSLGTHVAAKLQIFGTDERTLTDELCDMFYIWARESMRRIHPRYNSSAFQIPVKTIIAKTTQQQESDFGNDFSLRLETPSGVKYALIQAKVWDPQTDKIRCDSESGWRKLASQLILMKSWLAAWKAGFSNLAFLLIYVPYSKFRFEDYEFRTWEQGTIESLGTIGRGGRDPAFGITLIPFDALLDSSNAWRNWPPVRMTSQGLFKPRGISFSQLILEMLLCKRGKWLPQQVFSDSQEGPSADSKHGFPFEYVPYRQLTFGVTEVPQREWDTYVQDVREQSHNIRWEDEAEGDRY
jgi:hypothetical protein